MIHIHKTKKIETPGSVGAKAQNPYEEEVPQTPVRVVGRTSQGILVHCLEKKNIFV